MNTGRNGIKTCMLVAAALLSAVLCRDTAAQNVLASFNSTNGACPNAGLILSGSTLYGTTQIGGAPGGIQGYGTVFSVPAGGGPVTTLTMFEWNNGANPRAGLILSGSTLYGTTSSWGSVFSMPVGGGPVTTLTSFDGDMGADPGAALILSGSTLYGTTCDGGAYYLGTVFSVPVGGGPVTTLASFNGTNGSNPFGGLILSGSNFYGTTEKGGAHNFGTVFAIPAWGGPVTTLASFNGANGEYPEGELTLSGSTLYGTTSEGGPYNAGTVFSIPIGGGSVNTLAWFSGGNGAYPHGGLILSGSTLYGTTYQGGAYGNNPGAHEYGYGTVFSITPSAGGWVNTLASFNGANGEFPGGGLTLSGSTLYGTTEKGGEHGYGTVFALNLGNPIPLNIQVNSSGVVLSWDDPGSQCSLQTAPTLTSQFTNIPGATSPYTNSITGAQQYFQLIGN